MSHLTQRGPVIFRRFNAAVGAVFVDVLFVLQLAIPCLLAMSPHLHNSFLLFLRQLENVGLV